MHRWRQQKSAWPQCCSFHAGHILRIFLLWPTACTFTQNCVGQNKNKIVITCIVWRTLMGLSIEVYFHLWVRGTPGALWTDISGLLKLKVCNSELDTIDDLIAVVNSSSAVNTVRPFPWQWKEWDAFFVQFFKPIRGIAISHQNTKPGSVFMMAAIHDEEEEFQLLKDNVSVDDAIQVGLPQNLQPSGISAQHVAYLGKEVRQLLWSDCPPPWEWPAFSRNEHWYEYHTHWLLPNISANFHSFSGVIIAGIPMKNQLTLIDQPESLRGGILDIQQ